LFGNCRQPHNKAMQAATQLMAALCGNII